MVEYYKKHDPPYVQSAYTAQEIPARTPKNNKQYIIAIIAIVIVLAAISIMANLNERPITFAKETAQTIDARIWEIVLTTDRINKELNNGLKMYSSGAMTAVELYRLAQDTYDYQFGLWETINDSEEDDHNAKYLDAAGYYIIDSQQWAESIMTYLDSNLTSDLAAMTERSEDIAWGLSEVTGTRLDYLREAGFTMDEIDIMTGGE